METSHLLAWRHCITSKNVASALHTCAVGLLTSSTYALRTSKADRNVLLLSICSQDCTWLAQYPVLDCRIFPRTSVHTPGVCWYPVKIAAC